MSVLHYRRGCIQSSGNTQTRHWKKVTCKYCLRRKVPVIIYVKPINLINKQTIKFIQKNLTLPRHIGMVYDILEECIKHSRNNVVLSLIYHQGKIIGWSCLIKRRSFMELHSYIKRGYRGKGLSSQSMKKLLNKCNPNKQLTVYTKRLEGIISRMGYKVGY